MSGHLSAHSLPTSSPGTTAVAYIANVYRVVMNVSLSLCRVLPVFLIMVPFGVIAVKYKIIQNANECSCW